jgi:ribose 5-phosphate isomerase B
MDGGQFLKIILGGDHTGYQLKKILIDYVNSLGHQTEDIGTYDETRVDYPIYGHMAIEKIIKGEADRVILVCGTGFGISLAANKKPGIRCVNCSDPYTALMSRKHNDANAIALGARVVGPELAKMIIKTWLEGEFEGGRHAKRLKMIE